ncbi:hypothetical protein ACFL47_08290 [Candidatus Latescibacterota bacterium]
MNKKSQQSIGRIKAALVAEGQGIIVPVIATVRKAQDIRLVYGSDSVLPESSREHIERDIIPLVDRIMKKLGRPKASFSISIDTPGAITAMEQPWTIAGRSIDLAVFLVLLSAGLQLPVRQDIAYTGHISTSDGDISQVKSLSLKAQAALEDPVITGFCFPALDSDTSMKTLTPKTFETITGDIRACRGRIKLFDIEHIADAIQKTLAHDALVIAALQSSYFEYECDAKENSVSNIIRELTCGLQTKLLNSLENCIIEKDVTAVHHLLDRFARYYINERRYPSGFGESLTCLLMSLPGPILKSPGLMPMVTMKRYDALIKHATEEDQNDIERLYQTLYMLPKHGVAIDEDATFQITPHPKRDEILLDHLIDQTESELVDQTILRHYDEARSNFYLDNNSVESYDDLIDTLMRFYCHIISHMGTSKGAHDENQARTEAINMAHDAYPGTDRFNGMVNDAKLGTNGGLRIILDTFTEYLKETARQKHIIGIFREIIDPLDHTRKAALIQLFKDRFHDILPTEIHNQSADEIAENIEPIIQAFIEARNELVNTFRRL